MISGIIDKQNKISECTFDNYKMIDIMKYVAAIMVICVHCNHVFPNEYLDYFVRQILCRIAVPFFFMSSAYFVRKSSLENTTYVFRYLKKIIISYGMWSLLFIPIGLDWIHQNMEIAGYLLPFALLYGLFHIGTYYHLWYIPAMMFSIFVVDKLIKKYSYRSLFILAIGLYMFGSLENYYGVLPDGWLKYNFDILISIVFTTRSGLLYGMVFTLMGFYIVDHQAELRRLLPYLPKLTIGFFGLQVIEGALLYHVERLDMNFLLMLLPFSFVFFLCILSFPYLPKRETKRIRQLSKYYYFVHPVCIVIIEEVGQVLAWSPLSSGIVCFLLIVVMTHLLSIMMMKIQQPYHIFDMILAGEIGILITVALAGMLYQWKAVNLILKFELVPCLWFYISFMLFPIFNMIHKNKNLQSERKNCNSFQRNGRNNGNVSAFLWHRFS